MLLRPAENGSSHGPTRDSDTRVSSYMNLQDPYNMNQQEALFSINLFQ